MSWPAQSGVSRTELDPTSFLHRSATIHPDRTAVVYGEQRRTYAELRERVNRLASALRARGLERHGRVAALLPNVPELLELHHAVPAAGGVLVAINVRLSAAEVGYILEHSGARVLVVDPELEPLAAQAPAGVEIVRLGSEYEALLGSGDPAGVPSLLRDEEEPLAIDYTSGTTGRPKGVVYTYRGAYLNALGEVIEAELGHHPVYLWTLPMFHCNGWCFPWAVTAAAGTHVCLRAVDPELIWRLFRQEGVTHYNGSPTVQTALVHHPDAAPLEPGVTALVAGAPPSPTLLGRMGALNIRIVHVYGLTETYGPTTICEWDPAWNDLDARERARLKARQGVHYVSSDRVRVVDADLDDVPADGETMGEIVMRGNNVMKGYFCDEAATAEAFRGGWFHSGDLGVLHPDGYVEVRDRTKDIIISGGENVSTIEVEAALVRHPDVLEAAVVAMPDEKWGERPKGFVTLREGAAVTAAELIAFSRETLPGFKAPSEIEFGELPKTSTGKVKKYELRERARAGRPFA
jgi:fatty-acyl-CoA synthase